MLSSDRVDWLGLWTLYRREVWRFLKVWNQTIIAPVITVLLFLAILVLALGGEAKQAQGIPFAEFIAAGLIMMAVVQNAFANTSSSLILAKIQGVIIDLLMPPLSAGELTFAYMLGGVSRGIVVGAACLLGIALFVPITVHHIGIALAYIVLSAMMLSLLGVLAGIYANSFDQMAAFTNYIITPLSFLSGTFYSIEHLPRIWQQISHANPFFYMIDGFRYALTNHADGNVMLGLWVLAGVNVTLLLLVRHLFQVGWRLKN